ncbi:MAG TPA: methyltransferase domain-containing protein, partial [Candidatus Tectomicrobia bacterium]|nr:methyltransferase domain-containing protein [Candidatus Tectomicrobia bacterium]
GDVYHLPVRPEAFDFAYSLGVLHHLPDPGEGFRRMLAAVRPGGDVFFWVYGLEDMRASYRISHLRWVRAITRRLPRPAQRAASVAVAAALEVTLWAPTRALGALPGGQPLARRIPLSDSAHRRFHTKVRNVFDRLSPPVTHYHTADELWAWLREAGLERTQVANRDGRGWIAGGHRPTVVPDAASA